jgi:hypothetical protein
MNIQELSKFLFSDLISKMQNSIGLTSFVHRRSKFEGWLKVEVIDTLRRNGLNALPEIGRIDVSFKDVAIELKTINTNIGYDGVVSCSRPITKNTQDVIDDINNLKLCKVEDIYVLFVVFPIKHDNYFWQIQFNRITSNLSEVVYKEFKFKDGLPGAIYLGCANADHSISSAV